jgi:hypothetical protein
VPDTISRPEPSALVKASPFLTQLYENGVIPTRELERQAQGAQRLKELYSSDPWHARRAESDPDYWNKFYGSLINW